MSTVVVNASRIYEDILNALIREETEFARVEAFHKSTIQAKVEMLKIQ